jgi:hypothetical protein
MYDDFSTTFTDASRDYYRELTEERNVVFNKDDLNIIGSLNVEQCSVFDAIMEHVINKRGQIFLLTDLEVLAKLFCTWHYLPRSDLWALLLSQ